MKEKTLEEFKEHWLQDFIELKADIETLSKNLDEFIAKVEKANTIEELGYLSDCTDLESGLKHLAIF